MGQKQSAEQVDELQSMPAGPTLSRQAAPLRLNSRHVKFENLAKPDRSPEVRSDHASLTTRAAKPRQADVAEWEGLLHRQEREARTRSLALSGWEGGVPLEGRQQAREVSRRKREETRRSWDKFEAVMGKRPETWLGGVWEIVREWDGRKVLREEMGDVEEAKVMGQDVEEWEVDVELQWWKAKERSRAGFPALRQGRGTGRPR